MVVLEKDLLGKIYLVTGANSGIGYQAAEDFCRRGASLILLCRSSERGQIAMTRLENSTGNSKLKLYVADFSNLQSVGRVANRILVDFPRIDVLCNNAGGATASRKETGEGFETTFAVNHLAGFLLTQQLLPALQKAAEGDGARIVFTSSLGHTNSALDFEDINLSQGYSVLKAYGRSKLMNLLTAREIHRRYADQGIIASSFHPGAVRTPIWAKGGFLASVLGKLMYPFMVSVEEGTDTFIWLASSNDEAVRNAAGNYFYKRRPGKVAPFATDEAALKLWELSENLVKPFSQAAEASSVAG